MGRNQQSELFYRELQDVRAALQTDVTVPQPDVDDASLTAWFEAGARVYGLTYLLAHADDGVIWGRFDKDGDGVRLLTSFDATRGHEEANRFVPLRAITLQQARLFGTPAELLLCRTEDGLWQARVIRDEAVDSTVDAADGGRWAKAFDEKHLLWGTRAKALPHRFTLLSHGAAGLRHAVPLAVTLRDEGRNVPRLCVRHYLAADDAARVEVSRLCDVEVES